MSENTTQTDIGAMSFEQALAELEKIVSALEQGDVPLDKSIAYYERGEALKNRCDALLKDAEDKIEKIRVARDGSAAGTEPLEIEAVALDWKWLFIYPQYGVATVNEIAAPLDRPIRFRLTSSTVMNAFFIPALAGQIYAMPGMETKLHAVINEPGEFGGFSSNYSGAGYSGMKFEFHGVDSQAFDQWIAKVRGGEGTLDRSAYLDLEKPSENAPVRYFGATDPSLFDDVVSMCVEPGKLCLRDIHGPHGSAQAAEAHGGEGHHSWAPPDALEYDKATRRGGPMDAHGTNEAAMDHGSEEEH